MFDEFGKGIFTWREIDDFLDALGVSFLFPCLKALYRDCSIPDLILSSYFDVESLKIANIVMDLHWKSGNSSSNIRFGVKPTITLIIITARHIIAPSFPMPCECFRRR